MPLFEIINRKLINFIRSKIKTDARTAYNLWASTYDKQTDNPIVYLNEIIFNELLEHVNTENKIIVDVGCGTGALWEKILAKKPKELIGYELSCEMLNQLHKKFPLAKTHISNDSSLKELNNSSCDVIISTLVIGYIKNLSGIFAEWNRVLKPYGEIIITDLHPVALEQGAKRTFKHNDKSIFIKNYIHTFNKIEALTNTMNWIAVNFIERKIDDRIKFFYEKLNADEIYNKSYNTPILYGMHLRKL